jgi:hypothetical protein
MASCWYLTTNSHQRSVLMTTIPQVCAAMQHVLTTVADTAARTTGFVQRVSKLTGAGFVQTLVFGFLANPNATRADLATTAAAIGCVLTPQALDQRMTDAGAECLEQVLTEATSQMLAADPVAIPLLNRFPGGVWVQDTSTIGLPRTMAHLWCGGRNQHTSAAALKIGVRFNLTHGTMQGPLLDHAITNDRHTAIVEQPLPPDALQIADLGFFDLAELQRIGTNAGFWLRRLQIMTAVFLPDGTRIELPRWLAQQGAQIDQAVTLGVDARVPARLLAVRVPQEVADQRRRRVIAEAARRGKTPSARQLALVAWTLYVTNVPSDRLTVTEALVLGRARWQIELVFKRWKSHGQIDTWRSGKPPAIRCEFYAKLLAMILSHWVVLVSCWAFPNRSLAKTVRIVQQHALCLATALHATDRLEAALTTLAHCVTVGCRISKQRADPPTFQRLLDATDTSIA